jgi:pseudouridine kinase
MIQKIPKIIAIGGANIDITGISDDVIQMKDSNPGKLQMCMGGVIRNITENLYRLELPVKLITAIGDDFYGEKLVRHCREFGFDISLALISKQYPTSTYLSIIDTNGDMVVAINNMEILNQLTVDFFKPIENEIRQAEILLLDTNLTPESIEYLVKKTSGKVFIDTVSAKKAGKIKPLLPFLNTLKTNRIEAEILSDLKIKSVESALTAVDCLLENGPDNVFITMGKAGVVFGDKKQKGHFLTENVHTINETGAGDAFMAGIIDGFIQELPLDQIARWASAASILTAESELTNHPDFSIQTINNKLNQL